MKEIITKISGIVPFEVILPILMIQIILLVIALIDLIRSEETHGPKWLWAVVIILLNIVGPVLYLVYGRKNQS